MEREKIMEYMYIGEYDCLIGRLADFFNAPSVWIFNSFNVYFTILLGGGIYSGTQ